MKTFRKGRAPWAADERWSRPVGAGRWSLADDDSGRWDFIQLGLMGAVNESTTERNGNPQACARARSSETGSRDAWPALARLGLGMPSR